VIKLDLQSLAGKACSKIEHADYQLKNAKFVSQVFESANSRITHE